MCDTINILLYAYEYVLYTDIHRHIYVCAVCIILLWLGLTLRQIKQEYARTWSDKQCTLCYKIRCHSHMSCTCEITFDFCTMAYRCLTLYDWVHVAQCSVPSRIMPVLFKQYWFVHTRIIAVLQSISKLIKTLTIKNTLYQHFLPELTWH